MAERFWLTALAVLGVVACTGKANSVLADGGVIVSNGGSTAIGTGGAGTGGNFGSGGTVGATGGATGGGVGVGGSAGATGCSEVPLWTAQSQGFEIVSSGGFVQQPPADAGCYTHMNFGFSVAERTLTKDGCDYKGRFGNVVHLTATGFDSVVAALSALHSTCNRSCGADAPSEAITIQNLDGSVTYNSNFYAACSLSKPLSPPFIEFRDLESFATQLNKLITDACNSTSGGSTNLATCG